MGLRRPRPIRWLRAHPRRADLLLAVSLTALAVVIHLTGAENSSPSEERAATWWSVILAIVCVFPIAWRRSHPIRAVIVVTAAQVGFELLDFEGTGFIGVLIAIYSLGAHASGPVRTRTAIGLTIVILTLFISGALTDELVLADLITSVVILGTAFVLGDNLRRRRQAAAEMAERAERAERERDLLADRRVAAERARIARELHDVVAHSVSAMVIQASAARRSLGSSPDRAAEALDNIEVVGRRAMGELRSTLGVLRASSTLADDPDGGASDTAPQPTLVDLHDLIDEATDLPIAQRIEGDLTDVPRAVGLVGFRIVQEALTNVRRHGGDVTMVDVTVERQGDTVHIEVLDDGRGAAADPSAGPSYGIQGMRERVDAIGGFVVAEHRVGGGWQVYAELPVGVDRQHAPRAVEVTR